MTPLHAMLVSIASITISCWIGYLIARYQWHVRNPTRSWVSQEVAKGSLGSYVFWTTIGLFPTLYRKLVLNPIKYLRTPSDILGVGNVTPIEEAKYVLLMLLWYTVALVIAPVIHITHWLLLFTYRKLHPKYRNMLYFYNTKKHAHYFLPVDCGWVISDGEWVRDTSIPPDGQYLIQDGQHPEGNRWYKFVIPYYRFEETDISTPDLCQQVIVIYN
jgi:hypothetical protein